MEIKQIIENANLSIPKDNILYNEDMKKHTTFKIGGPAECFIKIKTKEQLLHNKRTTIRNTSFCKRKQNTNHNTWKW